MKENKHIIYKNSSWNVMEENKHIICKNII